jgi:repressor LexA
MTVADNLKNERKKSGLSQKEFADKLGMNARTYASYERGERDISTAVLLSICKALDISSDILLGTNSPAQEPQIKKIPYSEADCSRVPLIGRVAAGYSCLAEENISEYILTDSDILKDGYDYFWLKVKGDSMEPTLLEGDLVLVRAQNVLETPCLAVVTVDQEDGLVKYVDIDTHKITLNSVNPCYPPRIFADKEMNRVSVVGQVVESKRRY